MSAPDPVLWQLRFSHYNEKARWALDYKRVRHVRRSVLPGAHPFRAKRLYGGQTLPVLVLGERTIADSTRIIAALEEQRPEPPLYPQEPSQCARALELEDYFDEELGPHLRRVFFFHLLSDAGLSAQALTVGFGRATRVAYRAAFPAIRPFAKRAMAIDADAAEHSRVKVWAALDRLDAELGSSGYLVGETFGVADLTAASLLSPVVRPAEFTYPFPPRWNDAAEQLRDSLSTRPSFAWAQDMYARHRGRSAAIGE